LREAGSELKKINEEYGIKEKNFYAKFKDFKKSSATTVNFLERCCDFYEKTVNLIRWDDPKMTLYFFLFLLLMFFGVTFLPIRFIIFVFLTRKFYRGQNYHNKRVHNNKEVCRIELINFLEDNKLIPP
jgi:hypothetical protein